MLRLEDNALPLPLLAEVAARLLLLKLPHTFASQLTLAPDRILAPDLEPDAKLAPPPDPPQKQKSRRPVGPVGSLRTSPSASLASLSLAADAAPASVSPASARPTLTLTVYPQP